MDKLTKILSIPIIAGGLLLGSSQNGYTTCEDPITWKNTEEFQNSFKFRK